MICLDQKEIVRALCRALQDGLLKILDQGRIPANWDGFELGWWIGDMAKEAEIAVLGGGHSSRYRRYRKAVRKGDLLCPTEVP